MLDAMIPGNDAAELTSFASPVSFPAVLGRMARQIKVMSAGSGTVEVVTARGQTRPFTGCIAGDELPIAEYAGLTTNTNVAKLWVA